MDSRSTKGIWRPILTNSSLSAQAGISSFISPCHAEIVMHCPDFQRQSIISVKLILTGGWGDNYRKTDLTQPDITEDAANGYVRLVETDAIRLYNIHENHISGDLTIWIL